MATGGSTLFRQLARTLSEAIDSGEIRVGELLPTEAVLSRRYGVSRHTVREALSDLRSRGLIESKQGVGSIVVRQRAQATYTETYSSVEELTRFAKGTPIHAHSIDDVTADEELASTLRGRAGQAYVRVLGVRYDNEKADAPVGHVEVHVDSAYAGIRPRLRKLKSSIAETIESVYGVAIARIDQEITVELLTSDQAAALKVEPGLPALVIRYRQE